MFFSRQEMRQILLRWWFLDRCLLGKLLLQCIQADDFPHALRSWWFFYSLLSHRGGGLKWRNTRWDRCHNISGSSRIQEVPRSGRIRKVPRRYVVIKILWSCLLLLNRTQLLSLLRWLHLYLALVHLVGLGRHHWILLWQFVDLTRHFQVTVSVNHIILQLHRLLRFGLLFKWVESLVLTCGCGADKTPWEAQTENKLSTWSKMRLIGSNLFYIL